MLSSNKDSAVVKDMLADRPAVLRKGVCRGDAKMVCVGARGGLDVDDDADDVVLEVGRMLVKDEENALGGEGGEAVVVEI